MENPRKEITGVVEGLCSAKNADSQRDVLQRYFTNDASFDHPLCAVSSYPGSRDTGVLPIYQWLRIMFLDTLIKVHDIGFDQETNRLFVRVTQQLRWRLSPIRHFYAPTVELVVLLDLSKGSDGKLYIARQVDLYAVQQVTHFIIPYSKEVIEYIKLFAGFMCLVLAVLFQTLGFWRLSAKHA